MNKQRRRRLVGLSVITLLLAVAAGCRREAGRATPAPAAESTALIVPTARPTDTEVAPAATKPSPTTALVPTESASTPTATTAPSPEATPTSMPVSTATSTMAPTAAPTSEPTITATPTPTPRPTHTPTAVPTAPAAGPAIALFAADTAIADPGDTIELTWRTDNATAVTLWRLLPSGQFGQFWPVAAEDSYLYTIDSRERNASRFMLSATDDEGRSASQTLSVTLRCTGEWFIENPPDICPMDPPLVSWAAQQSFEHGTMLWLEAEDAIYVLYADGVSPQWDRFTDEWTEGDPVDDPTLTPPPGLWQPIRGFGLVWREGYGNVRERLGWATAPEAGYTGQVQRTSYWKYNHTYIEALNGGVWHLEPERSGWAYLDG